MGEWGGSLPLLRFLEIYNWKGRGLKFLPVVDLKNVRAENDIHVMAGAHSGLLAVSLFAAARPPTDRTALPPIQRAAGSLLGASADGSWCFVGVLFRSWHYSCYIIRY